MAPKILSYNNLTTRDIHAQNFVYVYFLELNLSYNSFTNMIFINMQSIFNKIFLILWDIHKYIWGFPEAFLDFWVPVIFLRPFMTLSKEQKEETPLRLLPKSI